MRRESVEVAAATRRRLESLGRELGRDPLPAPETPSVLPVVVPEPGRHAQGRRRPGLTEQLGERFGEVVRLREVFTPGHVAAVAVLVAGALTVTAWWALRSAPTVSAVPSSPRPVAATGLVAPSASAAGTPSEPGVATGVASGAAVRTPGAVVVVDVAGKVLRPGVATLPAGSRVIDALRHAGGALRGVDLKDLNLARVLLDGEQVLVGETPARASPAGPAGAPPAATPATVNLNTATVDELEALPGVGPVTAGKIVAWRTEHGSFTSVDELLEVDGIGEKTMAELAPHVTL